MKLKRNSKERLRKKRELEKKEYNKQYNNFMKELNKEFTIWQKIKMYFVWLFKKDS